MEVLLGNSKNWVWVAWNACQNLKVHRRSQIRIQRYPRRCSHSTCLSFISAYLHVVLVATSSSWTRCRPQFPVDSPMISSMAGTWISINIWSLSGKLIELYSWIILDIHISNYNYKWSTITSITINPRYNYKFLWI